MTQIRTETGSTHGLQTLTRVTFCFVHSAPFIRPHMHHAHDRLLHRAALKQAVGRKADNTLTDGFSKALHKPAAHCDTNELPCFVKFCFSFCTGVLGMLGCQDFDEACTRATCQAVNTGSAPVLFISDSHIYFPPPVKLLLKPQRST